MSGSDYFGDASQLQVPVPTSGPQYDLRPLSTGEVLDRTFQVYRSRFVLFAGLALLPAAANVVTSVLRVLLATDEGRHVHTGAAVYLEQGVILLLVLISALISFVLYGITQAATTWAVSAVYLGEQASIKAAFGVAFKHWFRYSLIVWRQIWAALWLPIVLFVAAAGLTPFGLRNPIFEWVKIALFVCAGLSMIYSVWAYLRVSLAVPAAVVESLRTSPALKRSAQLLTNRKFRVFLLFLLLFALYIVVLTIQSPILILAARSRGVHMFISQLLTLGIGFIATTLIGPVGAIGLCLFYFDERVRREGFDIEWMMKKVAPSGAEMNAAGIGSATAAPASEAAPSAESSSPSQSDEPPNPGEPS